MILGLDISSSTIGVALLDNSGNLANLFYYSFDQKSLIQKAEEFEDFLATKLVGVQVDKIFVEENLMRFSPGFSSAATILTLAKFNGIICYSLKKKLNIEPISLNVNEARKLVGVKIDRKDKTKTTKQKVFDIVEKKVDDKFKIYKTAKKTGIKKLITQNFDMADAYIVARAGYIKY